MDRIEATEYIKTEYRRLDRICHVDTSGIAIKISSRMTRQLGCFSYKKRGFSESLEIKISAGILDDPALFLDVIRHEYAHAVVHIRYPRRRHLHDDVWKAVCLEVGCIPKATVKAGTSKETAPRPVKYIVRCKKCGAESKYRIEGTIVKIVLHKKRGKVVCKCCGCTDFEVEKL